MKTKSAMKFIFFASLIAMLSLPVFSAKQPSKWIFIGDSYSVVGHEKNIPNLIANQLNLAQNDYVNYGEGGYGLAKTDYTFISLLKDAKPDPNVKNVLIIGGINNDRRCSKETVLKTGKKFIRRLKALYKNAKIYYVMPNWNSNGFDGELKEFATRITNRISWYKTLCQYMDVTFLSKSSNVLKTKDSEKYFRNDGHHPNLTGRRMIATAVVNEINSCTS